MMSSFMCIVFFALQSLILLVPFVRNRLRMRRVLNAVTLAFSGFSSASLALTDNVQVYGNTWDTGEGFMTFVLPVWPIILLIIATGSYIGMGIHDKTFQRLEAS